MSITDPCLTRTITPPDPCLQFPPGEDQQFCEGLLKEPTTWRDIFDVTYITGASIQSSLKQDTGIVNQVRNQLLEAYLTVYVLQTLPWIIFTCIIVIIIFYELNWSIGGIILMVIFALVIGVFSILLPIISTDISLTQVRTTINNALDQLVSGDDFATFQNNIECIVYSGGA